MSLEARVLYEFGNFRCDPAERLLRAGDKPVSLTPKAFDILVALLESNGRLLSKDELMRRIWPDSFVEEANLTVNISALRKVLGETDNSQQYIETVPKRGYRFVAAVREFRDEPVSHVPAVVVYAPIAPVQDKLPSPVVKPTWARNAFSRWLIVIAALGVVAILAGAIYYRSRSAQKPVATAPRRLAILPFRNIG